MFWTRTENGKDFDKFYGSTEDEAKFRFNIIDTPVTLILQLR